MGDNLRVTGCPFIKCTPLPDIHRVNKKLTNPFTVVHEKGVPDGTEVLIHAGNEEHNVAEVKNHRAVFKDRVARFTDLRFLGRSGRGKTFVVSIIIMTSPPQIASYENAIKVTVDGHREPRKQKAKNGFTPVRRKRGFNDDNDRDDDDSIRSSSGSNDTSHRAKLSRCGSPSVPSSVGHFNRPYQNIHPPPRVPTMPLMQQQQQLSPELWLHNYLLAFKQPLVAHPLISSLPFPARPLNSFYQTALAMSSPFLPFQPPPAASLNISNETILSILTTQARLSAAATNNASSLLNGTQISAAALSLSSATYPPASVSKSSVAAASTSACSASPSTSAQAKCNNIPPPSDAVAKKNNVLTSCAASSTTTSSSGYVGGKFSVDRLLKDK